MQEQLTNIEDLLSRLNDSYRQTSILLKDQIDAVVRKQLESLLDAMEELITHQETTNQLEQELRATVGQLATSLNISDQLSLGKLLPEVSGDTSKIQRLREQLISNVTEAREHHGQLLQLLQFAQDHTNETLRSIHVLANHHDMRYNQSGKTASTQNKTFAVNQTA